MYCGDGRTIGMATGMQQPRRRRSSESHAVGLGAEIQSDHVSAEAGARIGDCVEKEVQPRALRVTVPDRRRLRGNVNTHVLMEPTRLTGEWHTWHTLQ